MVVVASCSCVLLAQADAGMAGKKIIGFAPDRVDTAYLRRHVAEMEKLPIDGLMISVRPDDWPGRDDKRNLMWFSGAKFTRQGFSQAIADLKATAFTRFTDNFLDFPATVTNEPFIAGDGNLMPVPPSYELANIDWFDQRWSQVAANGAVAAYVAREGGLEGLLIDVESYGGGSVGRSENFF